MNKRSGVAQSAERLTVNQKVVGSSPTARAMAKEYKTDSECIFWKNQYGQGLILRGKLADEVRMACAAQGITPEELLRRALDEKIKELGL
jgi:hypothetical protein